MLSMDLSHNNKNKSRLRTDHWDQNPIDIPVWLFACVFFVVVAAGIVHRMLVVAAVVVFPIHAEPISPSLHTIHNLLDHVRVVH